MDIRHLKGRPPYPFETIGVLAASSDRLRAVLAEAGYLAKIFGARLLLIRIGQQTDQLTAAMEAICAEAGITTEEIAIIRQERDPVKNLLEICKNNSVDLLVLETKRREKALQYFLGSVARGMSRSAKCSLLLLTEPQEGGTPFRKMVVSGVSNPKTLFTLETSVYFAEHVGATDIAVVTEIDQPALAMATAYRGTSDNGAPLQSFLSNSEGRTLHDLICRLSAGTVKITEEMLIGRQGYTIRQYAKTANADLLAINSPDAKYGIFDRIFTHDMEYILEDLPCHVLIVHSRVS